MNKRISISLSKTEFYEAIRLFVHERDEKIVLPLNPDHVTVSTESNGNKLIFSWSLNN